MDCSSKEEKSSLAGVLAGKVVRAFADLVRHRVGSATLEENGRDEWTQQRRNREERGTKRSGGEIEEEEVEERRKKKVQYTSVDFRKDQVMVRDDCDDDGKDERKVTAKVGEIKGSVEAEIGMSKNVGMEAARLKGARKVGPKRKVRRRSESGEGDSNVENKEPKVAGKEVREREKNRQAVDRGDWTAQVGRGLQNYGATCFMNATLQVLAYCEAFMVKLKDVYRNHTYRNHKDGIDRDSCLLCSLVSTLDAMHFRRDYSPVSPSENLLKCLGQGRPLDQQEDAHEYFNLFISEIDKTSGNSCLGDLFRGTNRAVCLCSVCKAESFTQETYLGLSLGIPPNGMMMEGLEKYFVSEILDAENAYSCEKCGVKVRAQRSLLVGSLPHVLLLHLKRFSIHQEKISIHSPFDEHIFTKDGKWDGDLFAVIVHLGSSTSNGHYIAYVKVGPSWVCFDDSKVQPSSLDEVKQQQAYMLFYQQRSQPSIKFAGTR